MNDHPYQRVGQHLVSKPQSLVRSYHLSVRTLACALARLAALELTIITSRMFSKL